MRQSTYAMLGASGWHERTESGWINLGTGQLVNDPDRVSRLDAQEITAYGVYMLSSDGAAAFISAFKDESKARRSVANYCAYGVFS